MRKNEQLGKKCNLTTFVAILVFFSANRFNVPQFVARYKGASENAEAMKKHGGSDSNVSASKRPQSSPTATNPKKKKTKSSK